MCSCLNGLSRGFSGDTPVIAVFVSVSTTRWRFITSSHLQKRDWALWWCGVILNFLWAQGQISFVALNENGFPVTPRVPLLWISGEQHLRVPPRRLRQHTKHFSSSLYLAGVSTALRSQLERQSVHPCCRTPRCERTKCSMTPRNFMSPLCLQPGWPSKGPITLRVLVLFSKDICLKS